MSVTGVNPSARDVLAAQLERASARVLGQRPPEPGSASRSGADQAASSEAVSSRGAPTVLGVEPPTGTDPELWSILTHEERAYFSARVTSGPLTYSKIMLPSARLAGVAGAAPAIRGGRLDLRA